MSSSLQYSALTRLLTLNNQVHDLENQLRGVAVIQGGVRLDHLTQAPVSNRIADAQEEIDQGVRASLATCWLGLPEEPRL
jgi:hypothetical protein